MKQRNNSYFFLGAICFAILIYFIFYNEQRHLQITELSEDNEIKIPASPNSIRKIASLESPLDQKDSSKLVKKDNHNNSSKKKPSSSQSLDDELN